MKCIELINHLERLAPVSYACSWDNPGLLAGRGDKEVRKIYIALDATDQVVEAAVEEGCDLLLTHHPLIFGAIKQVNDQDFIGRRLVKLIQADMSCYSMHTNFDCAPGCMADLAADILGLKDRAPLEETGVDASTGKPYGIGVCGKLRQALDLKGLALMVKEGFGLPFVNVYGAELFDGQVSRALGAQVLITGDMGHHDGIDAAAQGLFIMDGGHYGLEHIFMGFMEQYIRERIDSNLVIRTAPKAFPATAM